MPSETVDTLPLATLRVGDVLLYKPAGIFGKFIAVKSWSQFSHAELYMGGGQSWASRNPEKLWDFKAPSGVKYWPFRRSELSLVRRARSPLEEQALRAFCDRTVGQKYDWWGLMRFFNVGKGKLDRMFCSEAVTRALREADPKDTLFDHVDADQVSPGMLAWTPELYDVWVAP